MVLPRVSDEKGSELVHRLVPRMTVNQAVKYVRMIDNIFSAFLLKYLYIIA